MKPSKDKIKTTITLSKKLHEEFEAYAEKTGLLRWRIIEEALRFFLKEKPVLEERLKLLTSATNGAKY